jgi:hypothetical protein
MFRYKSEPQGPQQYGLIAEEVAKVYPELVVHDAKGRILSVRYDELAPMLLNEIQIQRVQMTAEVRALKQQLDSQSSSAQQELATLQGLKQELHAALSRLQTESERIAQR